MRLFILSILFAVLAAVYASPTSKGYIQNPSNGMEYRLVYQAQPWDKAKEKCEEEGAKLAVPKSPEEFSFIQKIVRGMQFHQIEGAQFKLLVWLGASNLQSYPVWRTVDGENIDDTGFNTWSGNNGIPFSADPKEPHCVGVDAINPGYRDWWCHRNQPFICQKLME